MRSHVMAMRRVGVAHGRRRGSFSVRRGMRAYMAA